jgi:hypothetical protein
MGAWSYFEPRLDTILRKLNLKRTVRLRGYFARRLPSLTHAYTGSVHWPAGGGLSGHWLPERAQRTTGGHHRRSPQVTQKRERGNLDGK